MRTEKQQPVALKREVGFLGLLWSSTGSVIGSGWLFSALIATSLAGPSALISWVMAAIIVAFIALVYAELGGMFSMAGGASRYPHFAFGTLAGQSFGWFSYVQAASVAPIEVLAAIQYTSSISWASGLYNGATGTLNGPGYVVAIVLMVCFTTLNLVGIRWLSKVNSGITVWKVAIPTLTIVILLLTQFHGANITGGGGFFASVSHGFSAGGFKAILLTIPLGGIVFSFLGFEQAVEWGGESTNPQRDLPRAVLLSLLIGVFIYIGAQLAFIFALNPSTLQHYGWSGRVKDSSLASAPFATVATVAGISWLAWLLRVDAVVSPTGTSLIYLTSTSRVSYSLSRMGYLPQVFEKTSEKTRIPVVSVIFSSIIGLLFLLPFPSWSKLVGVVTSAAVLMYAGAPLALGALRLQKPDMHRSYRLPAAQILAPLAFVFANFIVYWAGWQTYSTLMVVMILGWLLMAATRVFHLNDKMPSLDLKSGIWFFFYLAGMGFISFYGGFGAGGMIGGIGIFKNILVGGQGQLPLYWDLLVLTVFNVAIYHWALHSRLPAEKVDELLEVSSQ